MVQKNSKRQFTGVYSVVFDVGTWANMRGPEERSCQAADVSVRVLLPAEDGAGNSGAGMNTRSGMDGVVCYIVH